jgi:ribose 5-phosphate isomerase RpiB
VLSCQNYDDEFAALNAKVAGLEAQISSLQGLQAALSTVQSSVSALQSAVNAIPDPSASIAALATSVAEILTDLGALETAVAGATTDADLDALKAELNTTLAALQALIEANSDSIAALVLSNASLKSQLEALGVDVDAVLAANSTFEGNLTITNAAELAYAKALGNKVKSIKGDLIVTVDEPTATAYRAANTGNGVTAAEVNTVLSQITFVVGNVRITTDASLDLSALTTVSGDYSVVGHDVDDSALASVGDDVYVDYDGPISFPSLATADRIYVKGTYVTTAAASVAAATTAGTLKIGTTSIDFLALTKATSLSVLNATHTSGGSHTSGSSATINDSGWPANELYLSASTTSVKVGQAPVVKVTGAGLTALELHYAADYSATNTGGSAALPSLSVTGAKLATAVVKALSITGTVDFDIVDSTATVDASGAVTMSATSIGGAYTSNALTNDLSALKTAGGISLTEQLSVNLPALTSSTGAISLSEATSFTAAALTRVGSATATGAGAAITANKVTGAAAFPALTKAGAVSMTLATSFTAISAKVESIDIEEATTLVPTAIKIGSVSSFASTPVVGTISDAGNVTTVELHNQDATYAVANFTDATSITVLGKSSAVNAVATSANAKATTITFGGKLGTASVTAAPKVTKVVTSGTIADFTVASNPELLAITSDHTEDATLGAKFTVTSNAKLNTKFTTKVNRVTDFVVTGNVKLPEFDASSMTAVPNNADENGTAFTITVTGNFAGATFSTATGMKGTYVPDSATTDETYKENSLNTLKPYLTLLYTSKHSSGGSTSTPLSSNTMNVSLNYISVASGTGATASATRTVSFDDYASIAGE